MKPELIHIHITLSRWGRWSIRKASGGLGYARMSLIAGANDGDNGHHDPSPPPDVTDADFDAVSDAVCLLPNEQIRAVVGMYVQGTGKSFYRVARDVGMHRDTLERLVLSAHRALEPMLARRAR
jgi:hypothetical protein